MYKFPAFFYNLLIVVICVSCFKETPVKVEADFEIEVAGNNYTVPVKVAVHNKSVGADLYAWTFEGGEPAESNKFNPDSVVYPAAGRYTVRLEAWNTTERKTKEIVIALDSAIYAGFTYKVAVNSFSPVEVAWSNLSYGGSRYYWEFAGGEPAFYEGKTPPVVIFREPGKHAVTLEVFNTRETERFSDTIVVLPALSVDFSWKPGKDDYDMEAPLTAELKAGCVSALSWRWSVEGGRVENDTLSETTVRFDEAGSYMVKLRASNGKEEKEVMKEVTVLENSNLYTVRDLKFGITTALNTIGGYYSSADRSVLTTDELTPEKGPAVDMVFWGLDGFGSCCFISPDDAALKALPDIPGAGHTWVINRPERFTAAQFDEMFNDKLLREMEIINNSDVNPDTYFGKEEAPHCVLFETADHRKGVVKVKEFVRAGKQSYVVADVKIQKK